MKFKFIFFIFFTLSFVSGYDKIVFYQPEQIHLALGETSDSLVVTWSTFNETSTNAHFGTTVTNLSSSVVGESFIFQDGGEEKRSQYIHVASLKPLNPDTQYFYRVGSDLGWSDVFWFKTLPTEDSHWIPTIAVFGDLGNDNARSLAKLQQECQEGMYNAVIQNGDFAYDLFDFNGRLGDAFMNQIQPMAAYVPFMTSVGNHEDAYNFSHYKARFTMPGDVNERMYFSFNVGPIHFISISTEYYFYLDIFGIEGAQDQYQWLVEDLKNANKKENREVRPWIVLYGHRQMYCSSDADECRDTEFPVRAGLLIDGERKFALEPLLMEYNVDLSFWAHRHDYERFWPIYDYTVHNGSLEEPYTEPKAPIHVISGCAGNFYGPEPWLPQPDYTAFRSIDYGYTRLYAHNNTHLELEQVSIDQGGSVIDHFWIITYDHDYSTDTVPR